MQLYGTRDIAHAIKANFPYFLMEYLIIYWYIFKPLCGVTLKNKFHMFNKAGIFQALVMCLPQ
jgi:hypothetical protein